MKKIPAIFLAFLLLVSNVSLTMATHFCGGQAVKAELMLGHRHLDCGMMEMDSKADLKPSEGATLKASTCCENEYKTLQVDDNLNLSVSFSSFNTHFFIAFVAVVMHLPFTENEQPQYTNYSPPLLLRDISVLNQVFLI